MKDTIQYGEDTATSGMSLPGRYYRDPQVFEQEVDAFLARHWIAAGHISEIPAPGDYRTLEYAGYSLILIRDTDGTIHAVHNVCRHRGARICERDRGTVKRLYCRYHGWAYRLNGELAAWRHMPEHLNRNDFSLIQCGVRILAGVIFVSLDPVRAPDFDKLVGHVEPYWQRYGLAESKVAVERTYDIDANWKLAIENNLECYHCLPSHPEYTAVNAFVRADEKLGSCAQDFSHYHENWRDDMHSAGVATGRSDLLSVDGQLSRAGTWPLKSGAKTASRDGRPVAPLLGDIQDYDESVTTGCFGFLSYQAAMCDYAKVSSYLPQSHDRTRLVMRWLVRADAVEGEDYDPAELCWLWDETTKQDKDIIELNAKGVASRGYRPGPYSELEWMTGDFVRRYLDVMDGSR